MKDYKYKMKLGNNEIEKEEIDGNYEILRACEEHTLPMKNIYREGS